MRCTPLCSPRSSPHRIPHRDGPPALSGTESCAVKSRRPRCSKTWTSHAASQRRKCHPDATRASVCRLTQTKPADRTHCAPHPPQLPSSSLWSWWNPAPRQALAPELRAASASAQACPVSAHRGSVSERWSVPSHRPRAPARAPAPALEGRSTWPAHRRARRPPGRVCPPRAAAPQRPQPSSDSCPAASGAAAHWTVGVSSSSRRASSSAQPPSPPPRRPPGRPAIR